MLEYSQMHWYDYAWAAFIVAALFWLVIYLLVKHREMPKPSERKRYDGDED